MPGLAVLNGKSRGCWNGWPSSGSRPRFEVGEVNVSESRPGPGHQASWTMPGSLAVFAAQLMSKEVPSEWQARPA